MKGMSCRGSNGDSTAHHDDVMPLDVGVEPTPAWDAIRESGVELDDPGSFAHYLRCNQHETKTTHAEAEKMV